MQHPFYSHTTSSRFLHPQPHIECSYEAAFYNKENRSDNDNLTALSAHTLEFLSVSPIKPPKKTQPPQHSTLHVYFHHCHDHLDLSEDEQERMESVLDFVWIQFGLTNGKVTYSADMAYATLEFDSHKQAHHALQALSDKPYVQKALNKAVQVAENRMEASHFVNLLFVRQGGATVASWVAEF